LIHLMNPHHMHLMPMLLQQLMLLREVLNLISFFISQSGPVMPAPYLLILLNNYLLTPFITSLAESPFIKMAQVGYLYRLEVQSILNEG